MYNIFLLPLRLIGTLEETQVKRVNITGRNPLLATFDSTAQKEKKKMAKSLQFPSQGVGTGFLYICLNQAAKRDDCGINSSYPPLGARAIEREKNRRRRIAPSKVEITKATPQEFFSP